LFDVLVVGGRVAGSATAILLARLGYRVALVDRDHHPSPAVSTHVFGDWAAFGRLGVLDDPRLASAPALTRFRTEVEGCATEADLLATPYARALRREVLDPMLIEYARKAGDVTWYEGARVAALLGDGATVTGARVLVDRSPVEIPARVVVGADGRNSTVARAVGARAYLTRPRLRTAYYAYFTAVAGAGLPALEYYWHGPNVVIVAPCDGDLYCICVMPRDDDLAAWRGGHEDRFAEVLGSIRTLAARLADATRVGPVRGSGNLRSHLRDPAGPGWALVGDAGAAVHPCIGAGIDHAVFSAGLLADAVHRHLTGGESWTAVTADYRDARDARVRPALESAVRLAGRGALAGADVRWLQVLLGMPGSAHDLGRRAVDVLRTIAGDDAVARMAALIGATGTPTRAEGTP
jgi:flavin-dependent dehydrogenase